MLAAEGSTREWVSRNASPGGQFKSERERTGHIWQQFRTRLCLVTVSPKGVCIRKGRTDGPHPGDHLCRELIVSRLER